MLLKILDDSLANFLDKRVSSKKIKMKGFSIKFFGMVFGHFFGLPFSAPENRHQKSPQKSSKKLSEIFLDFFGRGFEMSVKTSKILFSSFAQSFWFAATQSLSRTSQSQKHEISTPRRCPDMSLGLRKNPRINQHSWRSSLKDVTLNGEPFKPCVFHCFVFKNEYI